MIDALLFGVLVESPSARGFRSAILGVVLFVAAGAGDVAEP